MPWTWDWFFCGHDEQSITGQKPRLQKCGIPDRDVNEVMDGKRHYNVFNISKSGNEGDIQIYLIVRITRKTILHVRSSSARDGMTR